MKKIALTIAALALSAGAAFAENPNVGTPDNLYGNDKAAAVTVSAPVTRQDRVVIQDLVSTKTYEDGSAHGFSDHSPSSTRR